MLASPLEHLKDEAGRVRLGPAKHTIPLFAGCFFAHTVCLEGTMIKRLILSLRILGLFSLCIASCGPISPPESCGAGGTADSEAFDQLFHDMALFDETLGGSPRIDTEAGPTFLSATPVSVQVDSLQSTEIRFCIEERKGGGEIGFDEIKLVPEGGSVISLRGFETGSYVLRVIHGQVLIRNLPFVVE